MTFNFYIAIEVKISKVYNIIYNSCYINLHKLQIYIIFYFVSYKNDKIEMYQKIYKYLLIKSL